MACGARWGLRLVILHGTAGGTSGLNGLWCPLGIETQRSEGRDVEDVGAKWPVVPVGD